MPCGCGIDRCVCLGKLVYVFERISACCALSAIMTCIVVILMVSITIGAGVGYNYCSIDMKTEEADKIRIAQEGGPKKPKVIPETWVPPPTSPTIGLQLGTSPLSPVRRRQRRTRIRLVVLERDLPHPEDLLLVGLYQKYGPFDPLEHYPSTRFPFYKYDRYLRSQEEEDGVIPVFSHKNMSSFLTKILARHKNVTIKFYKTY